MQMVAAAKMRKAQQAALVGRPYADLMNSVLAHASERAGSFEHPLMEVRPAKKVAVVEVTADKGLCGSYNNAILKLAANTVREHVNQGRQVTLITVGSKGWRYFQRRQIAISNALVTSSAVIAALIDQPTTRREKRSMTAAT